MENSNCEKYYALTEVYTFYGMSGSVHSDQGSEEIYEHHKIGKRGCIELHYTDTWIEGKQVIEAVHDDRRKITQYHYTQKTERTVLSTRVRVEGKGKTDFYVVSPEQTHTVLWNKEDGGTYYIENSKIIKI